MSSDILVIEKELLNSAVFRSLSSTAMIIYLDFLQRRQMKKIGRKKKLIILNNGELIYTYGEAEKRGFTRTRFARAIDELVQKGFIDIAHAGNGYNKDCTLYSISERWRAWGTENFIQKNRPKDTRKGETFRAMHRGRKTKVRNENVTCISNDIVT